MYDRLLEEPAQGMYMVPCELFQLLPDELYYVLAMMPSDTGSPLDSYAFCGLRVRCKYSHMGGVQYDISSKERGLADVRSCNPCWG